MIKEDVKKTKNRVGNFIVPSYNPNSHYLDLTNSNYYFALLCIRNYIKLISDHYFNTIIGAKNVDLFMLTPSISSPMGHGSDSEAIPITFGKLNSYLVDSSQFGFEPLILNGLDKVYCYLPSMRGEDYDNRHLNQFFHCEMEMAGTREEMKKIIEGYIKILSETLLEAKEIVDLISVNPEASVAVLEELVKRDKFAELTFDEAVELLVKNGKKHLVNYTNAGRDISSDGEIELMKIINHRLPIWLNDFDRDRMPFYQKPQEDKVIASDLLFTPLQEGAFGGEVVGCGQRQDTADEMYESLKRQGLNAEPYEWYINLRRQENYNTSSGFGFGVERFITWALGMDDIKNAIIYPRLKNVDTKP